MRSQLRPLLLLFSVAVINYVDRQSLSVAAPLIRRDFGLSNSDYAQIVFWFLFAYTVAQPLAGRFVDYIGAYRGFAIAVAWWSLAAVLHASVGGIRSLEIWRVILGIGEAALLPASVKVVAECLQGKNRALGVGVVNMGIGFGAILAAPMMAWLSIQFGWRSAFAFTGSTGLLWVLAWLLWAPRPTEPDRAQSAAPRGLPLLQLFRRREVVGLMLVRFSSDAAWYFYLFWLPEYLHSVRGFSLAQVGSWAWIPYLTANLGSLTGGFAANLLMRRGATLDHARKTVLFASAALMPAALLVLRAQTAPAAIAVISFATFLIQVWASNCFTLPADLFEPQDVASVSGLAGGAGSAAGMVFTLIVGFVVDHFSYNPIFIAAALMHPIAAVVLATSVGRIPQPHEELAKAMPQVPVRG